MRRHSDYDVINVEDEVELQERKSKPGRDETQDRSKSAALLAEWDPYRSMGLACDIILALVPLYFASLAIIAFSLHRKPVSSFGLSVEQTNHVSPTIFPIFFAAIVGRCFKSIGRYRAERGTRLSTLERLIGCNSLFAAVERQFMIWRVDFLGIFVILTWALSPLGGQASLRLLTHATSLDDSTATIRYLPIEMQSSSDFTKWPLSQSWPTFTSTYVAALGLSRGRLNATQDPWNNVRIPSLANVSPDESSDKWQDIDYSKNVSYTSLLGVPVIGIGQARNASFELRSRYWNVTCRPMQWSTYKMEDWYPTTNETSFPGSWWPSTFAFKNLTNMYAHVPSVQHFIIRSLAGTRDETSISFTDCDVRPQEIESSISCAGSACKVTAIRPVSEDDTSGAAVPYLNLALWALPLATTGPILATTYYSSTPTEQWMMDPDSPSLYLSDSFAARVNLSSLAPEVAQERMSLVLNTFWDASVGAAYRMGGIPQDPKYYDKAPIQNAGAMAWSTAEAQVVESNGDIHVCNHGFATALLLISLGLLAATIATAVLRTILVAPDILGYVSSLTRDNAHIPVQPPSYLDGLERTRIMRDFPILLGDVKGDEVVGHIAVTSAASDSQPLRKGRLYD